MINSIQINRTDSKELGQLKGGDVFVLGTDVYMLLTHNSFSTSQVVNLSTGEVEALSVDTLITPGKSYQMTVQI